MLQVALFTTVSTDTVETILFTDRTNPQLYVDGKLTMCARLTVAFFFSAFMFLAILLICALMESPPVEAGADHDADEAQRSKMRLSRRMLAERVTTPPVPLAAPVVDTSGDMTTSDF